MSAPALPGGEFRLMGVLNVTPDSFSDGGRYLDAGAAIEHGARMLGEGADILDVGGESTRPGAEPVGAEEELARVGPVIEALAAEHPGACISIDTQKAAVAEQALRAGARLVNDVSAFRADPAMAALVATSGAECCLMHMRGEPRTMQRDPRYGDVIDDVKAFLYERLQFAVREGVSEERVLLDPGIGFGKTLAHNLELLRRLGELLELGRPIVVGTSRKSFIGRLAADSRGLEEPLGPEARLPGSLASAVLAYERGASVLRVHDVAPTRDALTLAAATLGAGWTAPSTATRQTS
ncbi:MAG TPA: dihydropteroate synthase [Solirubrobacteraceae bacterium]|nr:dihydropteroate synthase [Solirubrobacteraceae bacterium]